MYCIICLYIYVTYVSNGPGASVKLLLNVPYTVYTHVTIIKYVLTYLTTYLISDILFTFFRTSTSLLNNVYFFQEYNTFVTIGCYSSIVAMETNSGPHTLPVAKEQEDGLQL